MVEGHKPAMYFQMLLLFSGVSLAVSQKKNQPMGDIPAIFWSIFVGLPSPGKPHLREEKSSETPCFPVLVDDGFRNPRKSPVEYGKWFPRLPFLKGVGLAFGDVPVTSCPGAVGGNQDEDRSPCAEEVPGVSGLVLGSLGVGWLSHKSCAAGAWCSCERLLHVGQAIET